MSPRTLQVKARRVHRSGRSQRQKTQASRPRATRFFSSPALAARRGEVVRLEAGRSATETNATSTRDRRSAPRPRPDARGVDPAARSGPAPARGAASVFFGEAPPSRRRRRRRARRAGIVGTSSIVFPAVDLPRHARAHAPRASIARVDARAGRRARQSLETGAAVAPRRRRTARRAVSVDARGERAPEDVFVTRTSFSRGGSGYAYQRARYERASERRKPPSVHKRTSLRGTLDARAATMRTPSAFSRRRVHRPRA